MPTVSLEPSDEPALPVSAASSELGASPMVGSLIPPQTALDCLSDVADVYQPMLLSYQGVLVGQTKVDHPRQGH